LRIACVIPNLDPGGAQRVLAQMCNHFAAQGHDTKLVTLAPASEGFFFELSNAVELVPVGGGPEGAGLRRIARIAKRIAALRRTLTALKPDVVVSFIDMTNTMVLLATLGTSLPVIVSERVDPAAHAHRLNWMMRSLRSMTYPRAQRVVVQTRRAARFFDRLPPAKLVIIPNPVPAAARTAQPSKLIADGRFRIIGIGRLDHQKGFDLLIDGFAQLAARFADWDVVVFGDGPERAALQARIESRGLNGRISLCSPTRDIAGELARSHAMAFPSRYEGFPNALAEAMAAGLPVVAFENVSGVEDLIVPGVSGILLQWGGGGVDAAVQSLTDGLASLMASAELRTRLGAAASAGVQVFAPQLVLGQWDELIAAVMREDARTVAVGT
jgi:GalNAc-alpha-(1->4)-GalNAc-alpha-(1->3)-diNAcBac-PP-undecaprenol alpha-1,4-N-acetyl-D-galactosaminyltransferase